MKKLTRKIISFILVSLMIFNLSISVFATEIGFSLKNTNNNKCNIVITEDGVYIDNVYYTQERFAKLLDAAVEIDKTELKNDIIKSNSVLTNTGIKSGVGTLVAGTWWIPGIGKVVITVAGVIIIGGTIIAAGTWIYNIVVNWFKDIAFNKSAKDAVETCNRNKIHHIMDPKHNWNKFKKDPKWSDITPILIKTLKDGVETWEKDNQYIRTLIYKGETVVVRFIKDAEGLVKYISTAWCE